MTDCLWPKSDCAPLSRKQPFDGAFDPKRKLKAVRPAATAGPCGRRLSSRTTSRAITVARQIGCSLHRE